MKIFNSPIRFAEHLTKMALKEATALHAGLEKAAELIEKSAKREMGTLQPAIGPFNEWDELADSTKEFKERNNYVYNDDYNPLYNTGDLYRSISHEVSGLEAAVGSTSPIMVYQEFGTRSIPPRPVLGPAAFKNREKIKAILQVAAISGMIDGAPIHASLGYDMEVK